MKLTQIKTKDVKTSGSLKSKDITIDDNQSEVLLYILSQYSDPIGSTIREITSNALDSHKDAGINKPVDVRIKKDSMFSKHATFEVEDYGTGMGEHKVDTVYCKLLNSDKRNTNDLLGAWGLGSKSPLGYVDDYYLVDIYNGTEYLYNITKGNGKYQLHLISKESTDKENGVKVSVPIREGDISSFKSKIKEQLRYFPNIKYTNCEIDEAPQLYEGENFMYSSFNESKYGDCAHICLGNIYYPLNYDQFKTKYGSISSKFGLPIGIKFSIGELPVTDTRENIEYTSEAIELIEERYEKVDEEIRKIHDENIVCNSIENYIKKTFESKRNLILNDNIVIRVKGENFSKPKYKPLKDADVDNNLINNFKIVKYIKGGYVSNITKDKSKADIIPNKYEKNKIFFSEDSKSVTKKNKYIYHELGITDFYIISLNTNNHDILFKSAYSTSTHGYNSLANNQKTALNNYKDNLIKSSKNIFKDYDDIEVPEDWKKPKSNKPKTKPKKDLELIPIRLLSGTDSFYTESSFFSQKVKEDYLKRNGDKLTIYGFRGDGDDLKKVYKFLRNHNRYTIENKVRILKLSKKNAKLIKDREHVFYWKDFTNYHLIQDLIDRKYLRDEYQSFKYNDLKMIYDLLELVNKEISYKLSYIRKILNYTTPSSVYNVDHPFSNLDDYKPSRYIKKVAKEVSAYMNKYRLFESIKNTRLLEDDKQEIKVYIKAKGQVNPLLLERLNNYKKQKEENNE